MGYEAFCDESQVAMKLLHIKRVSESVIIDGELDDAAWQFSERGGAFVQHFPFDSSLALSQTEVMISYDEKFIYVAARCFRSLEGEFIISSLKRDFNSVNNDNFTLILDPFDDKINGFSFGVSPYNVQQEGLIANGGNWGNSYDWDNKWESATKQTEFGWQVEMAIP